MDSKDQPTGMETIQDIVSKYNGRSVYDPRSRKNYRSIALDRHADKNYIPVVTPAEPEQPVILTSEDLRERIKEAYMLYKKMQNIETLYFHPLNISTVINIAKWVCGEESSFNPFKGIYIYGAHGSGKTDFVINLTNTCKVLSSKYDNINKWHPHAYNAIYEHLRSGAGFNRAINLRENVFLDDFLYQDRNAARLFGNQDNVADMIVTRLYELHKTGYRHILTSNLPPDEIDMHPGSMDRMNEMFNFVFWEGESLRK